MMLRTKIVIGFLAVALLAAVMGASALITVHDAETTFQRVAAGDGSVTAVEQAFTRIQQVITILTVLTLLSATIAGLIISQSVSRPLQHLDTILDRISRGETDIEISDTMQARDDEIGDLAQAFDRMLAGLKLAMQKKPDIAETADQQPEHI